MGQVPKRPRRGRIGRTMKLVFTAGVLAMGLGAYYRVQGSAGDWHRLVKNSPGLLALGLAVLMVVSALVSLWLGPLRRPKQLPDDSLIFASSSFARTWSAVSGVLITGVVTATMIGSGADWFVLGIFGLVFLASVYELLRPTGPVTLSTEGITGANRRRPMIGWGEIESLSLTERNEDTAIEIRLVSSPATTVPRPSWFKRDPARVYLTPSALGADPHVMMDALETFLQRYRVAHATATE